MPSNNIHVEPASMELRAQREMPVLLWDDPQQRNMGRLTVTERDDVHVI
jgi:hypothetical protein